MAECHVEHPCEACQQQAYEREKILGETALRRMQINAAIFRQIEANIAAMPWWKRKLRKLRRL